MTIRTAFLSALFAVVLAGPPNAPGAAAHVFAPSLLELEQTGPSTFDVRWKQPELQPAGAKASPVFPAACRTVGERTLRREETGLSVHVSIECPGGLVGSDLGVEGLASTQAPALVRIGWEDGRTVRRVLDADAPTFLVPAAETTVGIGLSYAHLGLEHIAGGIDHLLFVLGLTLLVRGHRRLLVTVTAFTIGHSITLALAALGVVHVPQGPVEILIAASIYVLAVDLARRHLGGPQADTRISWMERHPESMAAGFGLFHGLGFAGALTEAGLPQGDIPAALLAFNVGIELGQIAFVALVLATSALWGWWIRTGATADGAQQAGSKWALAPIYLIGCASAFWTLERILALP